MAPLILYLIVSDWNDGQAPAEAKLLSGKMYAAATPAKYCSFAWVSTDNGYFNSTCNDQTTSTATVAEAALFDTVDVYYNGVIMQTLNLENLKAYGITKEKIAAAFKDIAFQQYTASLDTVESFWATFPNVNISQYNVTLTALDGSSKWYQLYNLKLSTEAVTANVPGQKLYNLTVRDLKTGSVVFLQTVLMDKTARTTRNVFDKFTIETPTPEVNDVTTSGETVQQTTVLVDLTADAVAAFIANGKSSAKSADAVDPYSCVEYYLTFENNNTILQQGYTHSICKYAFVSTTAKLVPGEFTITAYTVPTSTTPILDSASKANKQTITGTKVWSSKTQITPNVIASWTAVSGSDPVVITAAYMQDRDKLTGGEIAAIVIGSFIGAVIIIFFLVLLIRFCAYGCASVVAEPKMMM